MSTEIFCGVVPLSDVMRFFANDFKRGHNQADSFRRVVC
jgi:hypothetical protein